MSGLLSPDIRLRETLRCGTFFDFVQLPAAVPTTLSATGQAALQRSYDSAYSNFRLSDYPSAIRGFDAFLKSYSKHALAPNAQYWIGESYARLRQYRDAIDAERRLLDTYPDSAKAPDALLIIGTAESALGDNPAARKTFEVLAPTEN